MRLLTVLAQGGVHLADEGVEFTLPADLDKRVTIRTAHGLVLVDLTLGAMLLQNVAMGRDLPAPVLDQVMKWAAQFDEEMTT